MPPSSATTPHSERNRWGTSPWVINFNPAARALPEEVDFAIVGAGFTGLATAAWLLHVATDKTVAVFEAQTIGSGSSGHSGGMVLPETSAGDMPGLGDVLGGLQEVLAALHIDCDLELPGAWEISHRNRLPDSPIRWADSGQLCAAKEVPGGALDAGMLITGLARSAEQAGALICENARVENITFGQPLRLTVSGHEIRARHVLIATNAESLELSALIGSADPMLTLAVATVPLQPAQLEVLGLDSRKPFYTVDLPYLWGRLLRSNGVVFGAGLVHVKHWSELRSIDIAEGEAAEMIAKLELRVRGLDPVLKSVEFTHWWGGPILVAQGWRPVFMRHPRSPRVIVLGAYAGQGVALSVYLGRWAAEAMLGRRELPAWASD